MKANRVLIVTASAGGGHVSNARSLEAWIIKLYPHVVVEVYDVFKPLPHVFGRDPISLFYYVLSVHTPFLWKQFINSSYKRPPAKLDKTFTTLTPFLGKNQAVKKIKEFSPDIIIATYAPIVAPVKKLMKQMGLSIPIKLLVTDIFSAPPYWFGGSADEYYVMSEQAEVKAHGLLNRPIHLMPPLLHPKFFADRPKQPLRIRKNILLLAGGEGVYNLGTLVKFLAKDDQYNLTVICGKDAVILKRLYKMKTKFDWHHVDLYGFSTTIEEHLASSDLVITKAGPATIFEILLFKKPVICYHYIYGTELENIEFITRNNYGCYEPNLRKIPALANLILSGERKLSTMTLRAAYKSTIDSLLKLPVI